MLKLCETDLSLLLEVYTQNLEANPGMAAKDVAKRCIEEFKEFMCGMKPHTETAEKLEGIAEESKKCAHCGKILGNMTFTCPGVKNTGTYCSTKCGNAACEVEEVKDA